MQRYWKIWIFKLAKANARLESHSNTQILTRPFFTALETRALCRMDGQAKSANNTTNPMHGKCTFGPTLSMESVINEYYQQSACAHLVQN